MTDSNTATPINGPEIGGVAPLEWNETLYRDEPDEEHCRVIRTIPARPEMDSAAGRATTGPILVCGDCHDYHEYADDWQVCPKCGDDLLEADPA